jgi:signal transduction histidine kinase
MLELARADMTRPGSGQAIAIAPILASVTERYQRQGLTICLSNTSAQTTLSDDALEAILVSIFDNVQTHAGAHAKVTVTITCTDAQIQILIEDDGPGISVANQARIFDPFFTTARTSGGTGLGLPIARAIVTGAGGSLDIVPGQSGARFLVSLPNARRQISANGLLPITHGKS